MATIGVRTSIRKVAPCRDRSRARSDQSIAGEAKVVAPSAFLRSAWRTYVRTREDDFSVSGTFLPVSSRKFDRRAAGRGRSSLEPLDAEEIVCAPSAIGALTECVRDVRRRRTGPGGDCFVGGASSRSGTDVDATTSRAESRNTVTK